MRKLKKKQINAELESISILLDAAYGNTHPCVYMRWRAYEQSTS